MLGLLERDSNLEDLLDRGIFILDASRSEAIVCHNLYFLQPYKSQRTLEIF